MKTLIVPVLLAAVCILAAGPSAARADWGPSWVGGGPPGGLPRPAKFDAAETRCALIDDQSRIGVGVRFWCDADVVKGDQYQLVYQLRLQTKKGEFGPLLGTAAEASGTTFLVASGTADDKWNGLEGTADITRKDLAGMTHLPNGQMTTVRIEPQLLDQTTGKYVTDPKTNAIIVKVEVGENGRVQSVVSLSNWILQNGQYGTDKVLETLAEMDAFDAEGNNLADAFGSLLGSKDISAATKLKLIHAVSKDWVHMKNPSLWTAINELAAADNAELKAAAKKLLAADPAPAPTGRAAPAAAPAPVAGAAAALRSAPARTPAPAEGLTPAGEIDTGRLLVATFDGATSAKETLAGAARRMAGYFDSKPAFLGAYGDDKDQLVSASFKATLKGKEVRGVVIASVGPKGGSAAVAFDRADSGLATLPRLLATLPRGPVTWHDAGTADGSIRLQLPEGWLVTSGQQGMCDITGADGQFMALGIHLTINTPEIEQLWMAQQAQIGLPPRPSGTIVAPFTEPAKAVQNVFPQFYKGIAAAGQATLKLGEIVETTEAPVPQGLTGKAALVHYTMDAVVNRVSVHCHVVAYVLCSPLADGRWMIYFSQVGAPEAIFSRDLPMMIQAWKGYKISNEEVQRRMDDALQNMKEANRIMTESAANTRHTIDRCNADFDEVIHGYRTVEDTETGKWGEVDLGWSQKIVEKLNEHAGYSRYKEIPLRDQIFLP